MVAMELKLLRLESKVERREAMILSQQQRRRAYSYPLAATAIDEEGDIRSEDPHNTMDDGSLETMEIQVQKDDSIPGNSQNLRTNGANGWVDGEASRIDPRNNTRGSSTNASSDTAQNPFQSSSTRNTRAQTSNPRNFAIISSGASLTSAFTATSFLDGEGSTQMDTAYDIGVEGEEGMASVRSGDGDYDDDDDDEGEQVEVEELNDGSASSTLTQFNLNLLIRYIIMNTKRLFSLKSSYTRQSTCNNIYRGLCTKFNACHSKSTRTLYSCHKRRL